IRKLDDDGPRNRTSSAISRGQEERGEACRGREEERRGSLGWTRGSLRIDLSGGSRYSSARRSRQRLDLAQPEYQTLYSVLAKSRRLAKCRRSTQKNSRFHSLQNRTSQGGNVPTAVATFGSRILTRRPVERHPVRLTLSSEIRRRHDDTPCQRCGFSSWTISRTMAIPAFRPTR